LGYIIGGIACLLYAALVFFIAIKRPRKIMDLIKKKLMNKDMSDRTASIICYVFAGIALAGGIALIILGIR